MNNLTASSAQSPSEFPRTLSDNHRNMLLQGSGITQEVIDARGYFTATTAEEMAALDFAETQRRVPALILPLSNVHGDIIEYMARPDDPRPNAKKPGKLNKYEYPAGHGNRLDVNPLPRHLADIQDIHVPLIITEGVKKADSVVSRAVNHDACALMINGVDGWWKKHVVLPDWDTIPLRNRAVYIGFDSDVMDKERVHDAMQALGSYLYSAHGCTVRYLYLPSGQDGTKVGLDDFFIQGHKLSDLWRYAEDTLRPAPVQDGLHREPILRVASEAEEKELEWLWWPYLPRGVVATLEGDPGVGKSTLTIALASVLSRGGVLPDQQGVPCLPVGAPQNTLFIAAEDSLEYVIKKRLRLADADQSRIAFLEGWKGKEDEVYAFQLQYADVLDNALTQRPSALVVIDPIQAYVGNIDMNQASHVTPLLTALGKIAEKHRCTILMIRHLAKGSQGGKAMHRGLASVSFTATARSALIVEQHPNEPTQALLCHSKANTDTKGRTQIFQRKGDMAWCGVTRLTDEHVMGNARGPEPALFLEVCLWLETRLQGGLAWPAKDIETMAAEEGYKKDTLWRARKALGVKTSKSKDGEGWTWRLPSLPLLHTPETSTTPNTPETSGTSNLEGNQGVKERKQDVHTENPSRDPLLPPPSTSGVSEVSAVLGDFADYDDSALRSFLHRLDDPDFVPSLDEHAGRNGEVS